MKYSIFGMKFYTLVITSVLSMAVGHSSLAQKTAAGWMYTYAFDGNAYDIGPNRLHGQMVGGVSPAADRFGRQNKALAFNGTDGFIRIPFSQIRNLPTSNFTFTIWLFVDKYNSTTFWDEVNTNNYSPVFCKTETSPDIQYRLGASDKGFYFDGGVEGKSKGLFTSNSVTLLPGKWNMLAVTYNGYVAKFFLNGRLIACENISANFIQNNQPLIVGCDFPGQASYFSGKMDDFSIWEKFITEEDIRQIYTLQSKYPFVPPNITVPPAPVIAKVDTTVAIVIPPVKKNVDSVVKVTPPVVNQSVFEVKKGDKVVLKHVLFVQSKAELLPESYVELDRLLATLKQNPRVTIEVSGHTDNQGARDLNIKLSEERAEKVKDYLVNHGIESKRINVIGHGPDKPISPNDTEENRRLNRRVEFEIIQM